MGQIFLDSLNERENKWEGRNKTEKQEKGSRIRKLLEVGLSPFRENNLDANGDGGCVKKKV